MVMIYKAHTKVAKWRLVSSNHNRLAALALLLCCKRLTLK